MSLSGLIRGGNSISRLRIPAGDPRGGFPGPEQGSCYMGSATAEAEITRGAGVVVASVPAATRRGTRTATLRKAGSAVTVPLSILDLATIGKGQTAAESLAGSVAMAQRAEELGYRRVWYAEHHNMSSIASSATSVLIAHVAAHTETHPAGRRRRHAAQPLAADHRRAVRHPGDAAPGPDRPWPGPRAGQRPEHHAGAAPRPDVRGQLPAGRPGTAGLPHRPHPDPGRGGHPGQGHQRAAVHPRDPRCSAPGWPRSWACRTPSPRTSRRTRCRTPWPSTAANSSRRRSWTRRT